MNQTPIIGSFLKRVLLVLGISTTLVTNLVAQCPEIVASSTPPLCAGEPVTLTLENFGGLMLGWSTSTSYDFSLGQIINIIDDNPTITFEEGFTETTYVRANLLLAGCPNPVIAIQVQQPVANNTITSPITSIGCDTPLPIQITGDSNLSPDAGNNFVWQTKIGPTNWITISGNGSENLGINQISNQDIYLRRIVQPLACADDTSNVVFIEASDFSDGGTIIGQESVCFGENGAELTLTEYDGAILAWEESSDGSSYTEIVGTEGQVAYPINSEIAGTTHYRVLVQKNNCDAEYSNSISVTVFEDISNTIITPDQVFCGPTIPENIYATESNSNVGSFSILWQMKSESSSNWSIVPNQPEFIHFDVPLEETTMYRRIISGTNCSSISDTAIVTIVPVTQAGEFTDPDHSQQICMATAPDSIVLANYTGTILNWYVADFAEGPWTALNHTDSVLNPGTLLNDQYYYAEVKSGICDALPTDIYQIIVLSEISNNNISDNQILCPDEVPEVLAGSFPEGATSTYTLLWEAKGDAGVWSDAPGINNGLNYSPAEVLENTEFRRIVSSAVCDSDTSNTVTLSQSANPTATWSSDGIFCPGTPITITTQLQGTPPFTITFDDGTETYTIEDIDSNSYTITVYDTTETTYTLTAVTDAYCSSDADMLPSVVVITPIAEVGNPSAGPDQSVCGLSVELSGTEPNTNHLGFWTNLEGDLLSNSPNLTFTGQESGLYELIYTVESTLCGQSASDTVSVILDIIEPAVVGEDIITCSTTATLNAEPVELCVGHWQVGSSLTINDPFDPTATFSGMTHGNSYSILWITESIMGICEPDTAILNIEVSPASASGTLTASDQIICEGSEVTVSLSDHAGSVTEWLVETNPSNIQSIVDSASVVTFSDLGTSQQIYAVVQSGVCLPDTTAPITIAVNPQTVAGVLHDDQAVCGDTNSGTLVLSDYVGEILFWEISEDGFATADTLWSNSPTYTFENLASTHQFRVTVKSGVCEPLTSNAVTVSQSANPTATWSSDGIFCPGTPITITTQLQGTPPFTITFDDGTETYTIEDIDSNNYTITVYDTTETTYTLTAVTDAFCSSDANMPPSVVVITPIAEVGNPSAGPDQSVCGLSVELSGTEPNTNHLGFWTNLEGDLLSNSPNLTFTGQESGLYELIYTVESTLCGQSASDTVSVILDIIEPAIVGNDLEICSTTATLNATPVDWSVGHWQVGGALTISDPFDPTATLSGMTHGNSYSILWITESIMGVCEPDTAILNIEVSPASASGTLTASDEIICEGSEVTVSLSDHEGSVTEWLVETNPSNIQSIIDSASVVTFSDLGTSQQIYAVVQQGVCLPDTTAPITITVNPQTIAGILNTDQTVCSGINSGTLVLTDYVGEILFWEVSEDGFATVDTLWSNSPTYTFENLISTHKFRATIKSGVCEPLTSNTVTITTIAPAELAIQLPSSLCSGDSPLNLDSLVDGMASGYWTINGTENNTLDPQNYSGEDIELNFILVGAQCVQPFIGHISVFTTPEITLTGAFEACGPIATINAETTVGPGTWSLGENLLCNQPLTDQSIEITALEYGSHQVSYTAQNENCTAHETQQLVFDAQPDSAIAGEDQVLQYTQSAEINAVEPSIGTGTWSAQDLGLSFTDKYAHTTTVRNLKPGINWVTWSVTNGVCPANVAQLRIEVLDLKVPNAFSPNGDNVNDTYVIHGLHEFGAVSLTVWNRWGNTVYESADYQNDWNGTNKNGNELATDTYYYLLEGKNLPKTFKGFIVIQR